MSEHRFRVGQKVAIAGKDIRGEIAYIGLTSFGVPGFQWAGVILTEPKGKNNGTVESRSYFTVSTIAFDLSHIICTDDGECDSLYTVSGQLWNVRKTSKSGSVRRIGQSSENRKR